MDNLVKVCAESAGEQSGSQSSLLNEECFFGDAEAYIGCGSPGTPKSILIQIIEGEIIPRLFLLHKSKSALSPALEDTAAPPISGDGESFARLFLNKSATDIAWRLQGLVDRGVTRERVYLDFLAPVARRLSLFWINDQCSFDDMARGLACLDQVIEELRSEAPASTAESH